MLTLNVEGGPTTDAIELERLSRNLTGELRGLDFVEIVPVQGTGELPAGAKGVWPELANEFIVAIGTGTASAAIPLIVSSVREWLSRQSHGCHVNFNNGKFKVKISGDTPIETVSAIIDQLNATAPPTGPAGTPE